MSHKINIGIVFLLVGVLLSSCNAKITALPESEINSPTGTKTSGDDTTTPPNPIQLIIGTLMLEKTEMAVDAELASNLLPYWKMYQTLSDSDITSPDELKAVIFQICEMMTADQINYIQEVDTSPESMKSFVESLGIVGPPSPEGAENAEGEGFGPPEGLPEGMEPDSGREGQYDATSQQPDPAQGEGGGMDQRMILPVLEKLISMLETRSTEN